MDLENILLPTSSLSAVLSYYAWKRSIVRILNLPWSNMNKNCLLKKTTEEMSLKNVPLRQQLLLGLVFLIIIYCNTTYTEGSKIMNHILKRNRVGLKLNIIDYGTLLSLFNLMHGLRQDIPPINGRTTTVDGCDVDGFGKGWDKNTLKVPDMKMLKN